MGTNYYNLEGIQQHLDKEITAAEAKLAAWQKVTYPTKKDGKPFANMAKNFDRARYHQSSVAPSYGENYLTISVDTRACGYVSDDIYCWEHVKYLKDAEKLAKTDNYVTTKYGQDIYVYDLDDIKAAIAERIAQLEGRISSLREQRDHAEEAFNRFQSAYKAALEELDNIGGKQSDYSSHSALYYAVRDTVIRNY